MKAFNYLQPTSLSQALADLNQLTQVKILAGGTDLMLQLRSGEAQPAHILDLSGIDELKQIIVEPEQIIIGSMVTFAQVAAHSTISEEMACLVEACALLGAPQIRNQGTLGGNVVNGSPAADSVPPLVALAAQVVLEQEGSKEQFLLTDILAGVGKTSLSSSQLLTKIIIPRSQQAGRQVSAFGKLARRNALAIARMSMAATITLDEEGLIAKAGISLGAVAPNPFRATKVEEYLTGKELTEQVRQEAVQYITETVAEKLGSRPSAVYKNLAVIGVAQDTLAKLADKLKEGAGDEKI